MAAPRFLLAASAALALHACWVVVLGTAPHSNQTSEGPARVPRTPLCPAECPKELVRGIQYDKDLYVTPTHGTVTVTSYFQTPLGPKLSCKITVYLNQVKRVRCDRAPNVVSFEVSGAVKSCPAHGMTEGDADQCLKGTTIKMTRPATAATTTTTTTTSIVTTTAATTSAAASQGSQGLDVFLVILSVVCVLLRLLLLAKAGLAYRNILSQLHHRIIAATEPHAPATCLSRLHALHTLRKAVVLDLGLRLCLCVLLSCVCVCAYALYLTCVDEYSITVAFYIVGAACLLLHGFSCTRKVNSVIKGVMVTQRSPPPTRRHRRHRSEEDSSSSSVLGEGGCPDQAVAALLKVCLLLLLLCECVLSYGVCRLLLLRQGEGQAGQAGQRG